MGKRWNPVEVGVALKRTGHDTRSITQPRHLRPRPPPFSLFETLEVLKSQAAVFRKTVAECPKPRVNFLVNLGVLLLRSCLSGCHRHTLVWALTVTPGPFDQAAL